MKQIDTNEYKFTADNYKRVFINKALENSNCIVDDFDEDMPTNRSINSNGFQNRKSNVGKVS